MRIEEAGCLITCAGSVCLVSCTAYENVVLLHKNTSRPIVPNLEFLRQFWQRKFLVCLVKSRRGVIVNTTADSHILLCFSWQIATEHVVPDLFSISSIWFRPPKYLAHQHPICGTSLTASKISCNLPTTALSPKGTQNWRYAHCHPKLRLIQIRWTHAIKQYNRQVLSVDELLLWNDDILSLSGVGFDWSWIAASNRSSYLHQWLRTLRGSAHRSDLFLIRDDSIAAYLICFHSGH